MLSVKHLNTDASFLLTFRSLAEDQRPVGRPYHVLLDPWIVGSSKIIHSKISLTKHTEPACVTSLRQLPEPDLVIISQSKSDHCNEATLKQIEPTSKTIILAESAAARVIRSWKHFDRRKVQTLKKWEEPSARVDRRTGGGGGKHAKHHGVTRIPLPPCHPDDEPGEVTVTFIPQKRDLTGLHGAIGITFRSSPRKPIGHTTAGRTTVRHAASMMVMKSPPPCVTFPLTPPVTPKSHRSYPNLPTMYAAAAATVHAPASTYSPPPPLPVSDDRDFANDHPGSHPSVPGVDEPPALPPLLCLTRSPTPTIRSIRSCSTLTPTDTISSTLSSAAVTSLSHFTSATTTAASSPTSSLTPIPQHRRSRTLSVLFSPHGMHYEGNLESYATTHLINEAALPLTALLHCFDHVRNPWWLGGTVLLGAPAGREIAVKLSAQCWISCHDGPKNVKGMAASWVKTRRWDRRVLERAVTGEGRDDLDVLLSKVVVENDKNKSAKIVKRVVPQQQQQQQHAGEMPAAAATGEKLELRRVGSKLRLWPSLTSSSFNNKVDINRKDSTSTSSIDEDNRKMEQQQQQQQHKNPQQKAQDMETSSKGEEAPPSAAAAAAIIADASAPDVAAESRSRSTLFPPTRPAPLAALTLNTNAVTGTNKSNTGLPSPTKSKASIHGTQIIDLASGEVMVLTSDGPWNMYQGGQQQQQQRQHIVSF